MTDVASSRAVPALPSVPLLGNLFAFRRDPLAFYQRIQRKCGDIGMYRLTTRRVVMLFHPRYITPILVDHDYEAFEKSPALRHYLEPVLGQGLLSTSRSAHRKQRQYVAPVFQHRRIAAYADVMTAYAERMHQAWANGSTICIGHEMMRLTLGIVGETLFGANVFDEAPDLGAALTVALHRTTKRISAFIPLPLSWPTPRNRQFNHALARLNATVYRMIAERRHAQDDRDDVLSLLLASEDDTDQGRLSDKQIRDEVMTLFLAGHETTANALAWTWYLLAQHPQVYARVQEECAQVLNGRTPAMHDLPNLPYSLRVIKEAMRLYPPVHAIARQVATPIDIEGYHLPPGTIIGISVYFLHRHPDVFPQPEHFDPDRWLPEVESRLPRNAYLPFSVGPRNCIGQHFAMMEAQLILTTLAQHVTFEMVPGQTIRPTPLITLRPQPDIVMTVRRR